MRYDPDDRSILPGDDFRRQPRIDQELPPDSEPAGDPASGGKIAMFAVAIAIVLGVIFYGLNDSSIRQAGTSTAQNTNQSSPPAAPPGMASTVGSTWPPPIRSRSWATSTDLWAT